MNKQTDCAIAEPVAVLISVYGGDRLAWFAAAIESILKQDYPGEIRIYLGVDGPLSEDIEAWIALHSASFYRVVRNPCNIGLSKMLNRLLAVLADEDYLFRMDADDLCAPYRFSRQVEFLRAHPEVDVVGGAIWEFSDHASVSWLRRYPVAHATICRHLVKANPMAHVTVCFRRRFFSRISAYPERYRYNQDLALWVEGLRRGVTLANLDIPLVSVRTSEDFFRRRGYARAVSELHYYAMAIYDLYGFNWRIIFPLARFFVRILPSSFAQKIYHSRARSWLRKVDDRGGTNRTGNSRIDGEQR